MGHGDSDLMRDGNEKEFHIATRDQQQTLLYMTEHDIGLAVVWKYFQNGWTSVPSRLIAPAVLHQLSLGAFVKPNGLISNLDLVILGSCINKVWIDSFDSSMVQNLNFAVDWLVGIQSTSAVLTSKCQ